MNSKMCLGQLKRGTRSPNQVGCWDSARRISEGCLMRMTLLSVLCWFIALPVWGQQSNLILIVDGVTYNNATITDPTPTTVTIIHQTGIVTVPREKLSAELQKQLQSDPQKADTYRLALTPQPVSTLIRTGDIGRFFLGVGWHEEWVRCVLRHEKSIRRLRQEDYQSREKALVRTHRSFRGVWRAWRCDGSFPSIR